MENPLSPPPVLFCERHEVALLAEDRECPHCILEMRVKRFCPTAKQVIQGTVAPSWERERI
jgi:hypothetical protein